MLNLSTGRVKSFVLSVLIISSLILWGSLWFEDYHGFSAFFAQIGKINISRIFGIGKEDIQSKYEKIILPSRIIVNNGEEGHWILYPSESQYDKLWKITKSLLTNVIPSNSIIKATSIEQSEWNSLNTKSSIILFFDYPLRKEILSMLFKIEENKIDESAKDITAAAITCFGENVILYVKSSDNKHDVYKKYYFSGIDTIKDKDFQEIFDDYRLIKYASLNEALANVKMNLSFQDNVYIPIFSFSDVRRDSVKLQKVQFMPQFSTENTRQTEDVVDKFFKGRDYSKFIKKDGTHIFIDENNNLLKISPDGIVETELTVQSQDDFSFQNALTLALQTVEDLGGLNGLYISKIEDNGQQIKFNFDYSINGISVDCSRNEKATAPTSAAQVIISREQVEYKRYYQNYKVLEGDYDFSSDHDSIINSVFESAGSAKAKVKIEDIKLEYRMNNQTKMNNLPVWLVRFQVNGKETWITVDAAKDRR